MSLAEEPYPSTERDESQCRPASIVQGDSMGTVSSLGQLTDLVSEGEDLYLRWSPGPEDDESGRSRDELTGVELPGLSASALAVEPWWGERPLRLWVARRLYDYRHVAARRPGSRAWVLVGRECGRGPDNEPLVECVRPVAWIESGVVAEATELLDTLDEAWGSLDRSER